MRKIIFDLDDTLYKSPKLREARDKAIIGFLGEKSENYKELKKTNSTLKSLELSGINRKEFLKIMNNVPIELEKDSLLITLLEKLSKDNKLVIISNISLFCIKETITKLGISHLISEYYGAEDFSVPKPCDEAFKIVEEGDICIGNNFNKDLEIPKNKGAITILISDSKDDRADYNVKGIYEIEDIIFRLM